MIVIGIDPASDGSACIMRQKNVLVSIAWSRKTRSKNKVKYKIHDVSISIYGDDEIKKVQCKTGADIGAQIGAYVTLCKQSDDEPLIIASEDAYIGRNKHTGIVVARFAGLVVGALHCYTRAQTNIVWVKPTVWRWNVIRLKPATKREQCKIASLKYVPTKAPTVNQHLDKLGKLDHITDATGVALYAYNEHQSKNTNT